MCSSRGAEIQPPGCRHLSSIEKARQNPLLTRQHVGLRLTRFCYPYRPSHPNQILSDMISTLEVSERSVAQHGDLGIECVAHKAAKTN